MITRDNRLNRVETWLCVLRQGFWVEVMTGHDARTQHPQPAPLSPPKREGAASGAAPRAGSSSSRGPMARIAVTGSQGKQCGECGRPGFGWLGGPKQAHVHYTTFCGYSLRVIWGFRCPTRKPSVAFLNVTCGWSDRLDQSGGNLSMPAQRIGLSVRGKRETRSATLTIVRGGPCQALTAPSFALFARMLLSRHCPPPCGRVRRPRKIGQGPFQLPAWLFSPDSHGWTRLLQVVIRRPR